MCFSNRFGVIHNNPSSRQARPDFRLCGKVDVATITLRNQGRTSTAPGIPWQPIGENHFGYIVPLELLVFIFKFV